MKIAICDDEIKFVTELQTIIYAYINNRRLEAVVDVYKSGDDLINSEKIYDIVYLDYQMPGINGMETARKLRDKNIWCSLVFVTNFPDFVFDAFTVNTFRFLLKPVEKNGVFETLDDYYKKRGNDYPIIIRSERINITVDTKNIVFLEALGKHCIVHMKDNKVESSKTMAVISKELPTDHFFRIHKSYVINFDHVKGYFNTELRFTNGERVYMSKKYIGMFKNEYENYCDLKNRSLKSI